MRNLSPEDHKRIGLAVAAAQNATAAKFELVVVPASDHYALFPVLWGALVSMAATAGLALVRPLMGIGTGFMVQIVVFVLAALILDWWPIRLRIAPALAKRIAANRMAHHEFAVRFLAKTEGRGGLMLFVSQGERYVEIIADKAVHARVGQTAWDRIVGAFTAAMKQDRPADSLVGVINSIGEILGREFPKTPETTT